MNLKKAVSVGIGFFIAFIGLQNAKIVVGGATLVQLFSLDAVEMCIRDRVIPPMLIF